MEMVEMMFKERGELILLLKENMDIVEKTTLYSFTEVAIENGLKSAKELNNLLVTLGIQFKSNDEWILNTEYSNLNYTTIIQHCLDNGTVINQRMLTTAGRKFITNLLEWAYTNDSMFMYKDEKEIQERMLNKIKLDNQSKLRYNGYTKKGDE